MLISHVILKLPSIPLTYNLQTTSVKTLQPRDSRATYLHRMRQHPRQPERNLLGVLLTVHCDLEAVAEVDVDDLLCDGVDDGDEVLAGG